MLLFRAETWTTAKREDSKIQNMEMKFLRTILKKTKGEKIRNTNIRLELRVGEIKNGIQKRDGWRFLCNNQPILLEELKKKKTSKISYKKLI